MLSLQKKPISMIVHQVHPLNAGPPPDAMREAFFTPQQSFFIRNHGTIPAIEDEKLSPFYYWYGRTHPRTLIRRVA